jgi:hypothetical protein
VIFNTNEHSSTKDTPVSSECCETNPKHFALQISSLSHDSMLITKSGIYVSNKFQKLNILLKMFLQFTCSKTSDLPSILYAALVAESLYHVPVSVSFLSRCIVAVSLFAVLQTKVEFSWIVACRILSGVRSLQVPTAKHCNLFLSVGSSPPKPQTLRQRRASHLASLRF